MVLGRRLKVATGKILSAADGAGGSVAKAFGFRRDGKAGLTLGVYSTVLAQAQNPSTATRKSSQRSRTRP